MRSDTISTALLIHVSWIDSRLRPHHPLYCTSSSSATTARAASASDDCESATSQEEGGVNLQFQMAMRTLAMPLTMAMKNEAMALKTALMAPAMAEMMLPMVAGCELGWEQ